MTDETIQERIERAQSQDMEVSLVDTDPVVVQVYNEASDRIHTVIPDSTHCSCEDHTYRGIICKHLIELLQHEGHIGDVTRESLKQERENIQLEQAELQEKMDRLQEQREQISEALTALDLPHIRQQTIEEISDGLKAGSEARESEDSGYEVADKAFEEMVAELTLTGDGGESQ